MKHVVNTSWKENMVFEADMDGHTLTMDAPQAGGGSDKGPRPKPLMLAALAGCTGMDVIGMLKKMRVEVKGFNVIVEGDLTEDIPKHYKGMHVIYEFEGRDLPMDKLEKAVQMSKEKYCGVSYVYGKAMDLTQEIRVINQD